jgi:hypothetical protein
MRGSTKYLRGALLPFDDVTEDDVNGWLAEMENEGMVERYKVAGNSYLRIINWSKHQKIDRPSPSKIPPPSEILSRNFDDVHRNTAISREDSMLDRGPGSLDHGTGSTDHGNLAPLDAPAGDLSKPLCTSGLQKIDSEFEQFYEAYPRKIAKGAANKAYRAARKKASAALLLAGLTRQVFDGPEQFIPYPASWLNAERWRDEPPAADPLHRAATAPATNRMRDLDENQRRIAEIERQYSHETQPDRDFFNGVTLEMDKP